MNRVWLIITSCLLLLAGVCCAFWLYTGGGFFARRQASVSVNGPAAALFSSDENESEENLPAYFNLADLNKAPEAKNQGSLSTCWAFAATAALQSVLLPEETWDFSEDNMIYNSCLSEAAQTGGNLFAAAAYLAAWKGPVPEEDDPYNDGQSSAEIPAVKHVQEIVFPENKNQYEIKKLIYENGAVVSSLYIEGSSGGGIGQEYYNEESYAYYYGGDEEANHEIIIIGWDDSYPRENFKGDATEDGAYICVNSWGSDFGDNGIFYVSYADSAIGTDCMAYTRVDGADNYDAVYQYDEAGWLGNLGFGRAYAYAANVFTAEEEESLKAVSFYATDEDTAYSIYVCEDYEDEASLTECVQKGETAASGTLDMSGYYTAELEGDFTLSKGESFAVILMISTSGTQKPIAVETQLSASGAAEVSLEGEISYVSSIGKVWARTQDENECTVCIKAFTERKQ